MKGDGGIMKFFKTNDEGKLRLTEEGDKKYNLFIKSIFVIIVSAKITQLLLEFIVRINIVK